MDWIDARSCSRIAWGLSMSAYQNSGMSRYNACMATMSFAPSSGSHLLNFLFFPINKQRVPSYSTNKLPERCYEAICFRHSFVGLLRWFDTTSSSVPHVVCVDFRCISSQLQGSFQALCSHRELE